MGRQTSITSIETEGEKMISLLKIRDIYFDPRYCEFIIDDEEAVKGLPDSVNGTDEFSPCAIGSKAYTSDEKITYRLGNDNEWHKVVGGGGGSGGGGDGGDTDPEDVEPIDTSDIESLFDFGG